MKLHTGNGGITGMAMSHDEGDQWWYESLCPEARRALEVQAAECRAAREAELAAHMEAER